MGCVNADNHESIHDAVRDMGDDRLGDGRLVDVERRMKRGHNEYTDNDDQQGLQTHNEEIEQCQ